VFRFFTTSKWAVWAYVGSFVILASIWVQVQIDVMINEWFGEFYDMVQKALGEANSVTMGEYTGGLLSFAKLAAIYKQLQTGVREKEKEETKGESVIKSRR